MINITSKDKLELVTLALSKGYVKDEGVSNYYASSQAVDKLNELTNEFGSPIVEVNSDGIVFASWVISNDKDTDYHVIGFGSIDEACFYAYYEKVDINKLLTN